MPSPSYDERLIAMFDSYCKEVSRNCSGEYKGATPHDDMMERLLNARRGG